MLTLRSDSWLVLSFLLSIFLTLSSFSLSLLRSLCRECAKGERDDYGANGVAMLPTGYRVSGWDWQQSIPSLSFVLPSTLCYILLVLSFSLLPRSPPSLYTLVASCTTPRTLDSASSSRRIRCAPPDWRVATQHELFGNLIVSWVKSSRMLYIFSLCICCAMSSFSRYFIFFISIKAAKNIFMIHWNLSLFN